MAGIYRKVLVLFLALILLPMLCFAANDFTGDGNCKALWRFENGVETTDTIGTNTLVDRNTVTVDGVNYKEGAQSIIPELDTAESYYVTDANLDAGFPFKNGDANKKISACFWFKAETSLAAAYLVAKYTGGGNNRSFAIMFGTDSKVWPRIGYNGGASLQEAPTVSAATTDGQWYHVGITFQDSDGAYKIRIWGDTESAVISNVADNFTENIYISTMEFTIAAKSGGGATYDGNIDEVVVFDDILTDGEIDEIRAGTYGAAAGLSIPIAMHHYKQMRRRR